MKLLPLRPSFKRSDYWRGEPLKRNSAWLKLRERILLRDRHSCRYCGHQAYGNMRIHHLGDPQNNSEDNLLTCCVACHAVQHLGKNLKLGRIEIWESTFTQLAIVRLTREGMAKGKTQDAVKRTLCLKRGLLPPKSVLNVTLGIEKRDDLFNLYLPRPLVVVFIKLKLWQLETERREKERKAKAAFALELGPKYRIL